MRRGGGCNGAPCAQGRAAVHPSRAALRKGEEEQSTRLLVGAGVEVETGASRTARLKGVAEALALVPVVWT